jgi:hypothetical protein
VVGAEIALQTRLPRLGDGSHMPSEPIAITRSAADNGI